MFFSWHCFPLRSLRPLRKNFFFQLLALCLVRAGVCCWRQDQSHGVRFAANNQEPTTNNRPYDRDQSPPAEKRT
jgi:hypothetical protein